jgi:hypothetical protein
VSAVRLHLMRLSSFLWFLFFIVCIGAGFLHGYLPQGLVKNFFFPPPKIRVLTTDELLFPKELRTVLEQELHITIEATVTRDWDLLLAKMVASPSLDLIFLPSYWAATLRQQNLLASFTDNNSELAQRVSSDFIEGLNITPANIPAPNGNGILAQSSEKKSLDFLPIYWIKTGFLTELNQDFTADLKEHKQKNLFLLADEDLILNHFLISKSQDIWPLLEKRKILTLQLDELNRFEKNGITETTINEIHPELQTENQLSALLVWGAIIPSNSENKSASINLLKALTNNLIQEKLLKISPLNSTLALIEDPEIPEQRKAHFLRRMQLKDTLLIEQKEISAKQRLRDEFDFSF